MNANSVADRGRTPGNLSWATSGGTVPMVSQLARRVSSFLKPDFERDVVCRKCHWRCSRRSRLKIGVDLVLAVLFLRPFRCRSCRRRFYRFAF
jgi:hypothetical protein